ncbi:MAG: extracellular solute-binding protein [Propionibacteriaceae bacterium]|nr:extracellular solute-binding protein [Propionibacteriaceae bacterium]
MATMKSRISWGARLGLVIGLGLSMMGVSACASSAPPAPPASTGQSSAALSGELQILVSSADASDAAFKDVNTAFQEQYPDVKVVFSSVPNDQYPAAQSSRLTAANVDIVVAQAMVNVPSYATGAESNDAQLAAAGGYVDLTSEPFMQDFNQSVLDSIKFSGKNYSVPTGLSYYSGVYYNKAMFAKYNLSVPTTWSQFVTVCQTLQNAGITPLGIGGKDQWPAGLPETAAVQGVYPDTASKQQAMQGLWTQTLKLTDSDPLKVLQTVQQIYSFADPNFPGIAYADIPAAFAKGTYAMTPDGTWNSPVIASAVNGAFDVGYFPIPTSDNADNNKFLNGKVELQLAVPSNAPNKDAALAWLSFFSQKDTYTKFVAEAGFAPTQPGIDAGAFLNSIASYTSTFLPGWDQIWVPNPNAGQAASEPFNVYDLTPMGKLDAAGAAQQAQQDWAAGF